MMVDKSETWYMEYNIPDCFHGAAMDTQGAHIPDCFHGVAMDTQGGTYLIVVLGTQWIHRGRTPLLLLWLEMVHSN
jgi:hypothetical protein